MIIMGKTNVVSICIFAAITVAAVAIPLEQSGSCARQCVESSKFNYENGKHYVYDYEMETVSTLEGTTTEASRLHMKSTVELHVTSKCEMVMKLSGVTLEQSESTDSRRRIPADLDGSFRRSLEAYPLRFSFQNGRVENVCPRNEETIEALNIKRAILSAFQTTTGNLEDSEQVLETDISGTCTTTYEALPRGYRTQSIRKIKNLASCSAREESPLFDSKSKPLLKGMQECTQNYRSNRLESVQCTESHLLRPFSRQQKNGALTKVTLSLTYRTEGRSAFTGNEYFADQMELNFDHSEIEREQRNENIAKADEALRALSQASVNDIRPSVPRLFTNLVHSLQPLAHPDLVNIYRRVSRLCPGNERANKMLVDAIAMCGSSGAAKMVSEMASNGDLSDADLTLYLSSLVFVKNPNKEMLVALTPLLERRESFLGVSSLVHTYCSKNPECQREREVQTIVRKIANALGGNCQGNNKDETLTILKALGNMGVNSEVESTLRQCVQNKDLGDEIRVAALQSFRRVPCQSTPLSTMMDVFRDRLEKVEVRIASFNAMMKCPNMEVIEVVKDMLANERINQVGSFVFTYLEQIPRAERQEMDLNKIMDDVAMMNKFNTDFRKFSRAYSNNFFLKSIDFGASAKAQSVFTPEGFLPRSLMLNLTVDVFGNNVNLLEIEGRAEGMERLVESLFGPEGYLRGESNKNKKNKARQEERAIEMMGHKYNAKGLFHRESVASVDMKIFGNSMLYKRFGMENTNNVGMSYETMSLPEILNAMAVDRDYTFTKSAVLFDTTFTVPTAGGLPLRLTLDGTTSVDLKIKGKMDMRSLDSIDVSGVFQPSGAIEMSATMRVEATKTSSVGLRVIANLHSSTMIDGLLKIQSGKLVKSQINVPRENVELFDLQTRIFLIKGDKEESPAMAYSNDVNTVRKCVGNDIVGMQLCGEMELPTSRKGMPLFPLNGQTFLKAYLHKTDTTLTRYDFDMSYNNNNEKIDFLCKFNTPGSNIDREISAGLQVNYQENDMTFNLFARAPANRMAITGKHINNDAERRLTLAASVNDMEQMSVEATMATSQDENGGFLYTPSLIVRGPVNNAKNILTVRGNTLIKVGEKYSAELSIEDMTVRPVVLKGEVSLGNRNEIQMGLSSSAAELSLNGYLTARKNAYAMKGTVEYKLNRGRKEKLEIAGKFRDHSANSLVKYSGTTSIHCTALPEYRTEMSFETQSTEGQIENSLELTVGDSKSGNLHKITLQEILKYEGTLYNNKAEASFRLIYPQRDIDFLVKGEHENTMNSIKDQVTARLGANTEYVMISSASMEGMNVNGNFKLDSTLGGSIVNVEVSTRTDDRITANLISEYKGRNFVKAEISYLNRGDNRKMDAELKTEMTAFRNPKMSANLKVKSDEGRHYTASANFDMGRGLYAVNTQYTFIRSMNHRASALLQTPSKAYSVEAVTEGNSEQFSMKANLLADRRMTALVNILNSERVKTCSLNLMMDADRDTTNSIRFEGEYKPEGKGHQGKFSLSYPGNRMSGSFDGSVEGSLSKRAKSNLNAELEYTEGRRVRVEMSGHVNRKSAGVIAQGEIKMRTPFEGMEEMSLGVQHTEMNNEMKNEINAEYQRGKKISLTTEVKVSSDPNNAFLDIAARLATPFKDFEYMTGKTSFKINPADASFTIMGRRANRVLEVTGAASKQPLSLTLNMTTPYDALSQASAFMAIEPTNAGQFKSQAEVMYNNRHQYTVAIEGNTDSNDRQRSCTLEVSTTTTIRNYERMRTRLTYNHLRREINAALDSSLNNEKLTLKFKGLNSNNRNGKNMYGSFSYSSTMDKYRVGEIVAKHTSDSNKMLTSLTAQLINDIVVESELSFNSAENTEAGFSFKGNNLLKRALVVSANGKLEGSRMTANAIYNYGDSNNRADMSAVLTQGRNLYNVNARLNVIAPDMNMDDIRFNFEHQRQQMLFTTQMTASSNRKEYKASHELNINDNSNFVSKLNIFTPIRKYRSISFTVDQSSNRNSAKHVSEVLVSGVKFIAFTGEYSHRPQNRYSSTSAAKMSMLVPFESLSDLAIETSYEVDAARSFYQPRLNIVYNKNGRFDFEAKLDNSIETPILMAKLTSTIRNMEDMAFSGKLDTNSNEKMVEASFKYATEREVTGRISYMYERNSYSTRITITTPFRGIRTMGYQGTLSFKRNEKEGDIKINYENNKINLNGKFTPNSFALSYATPYSGYERAALRGSLNGNLQRFDANLQCEYSNNKKIDATLTHETDEKLITRLVITTPFRGYKNMVVNTEMQLVGDLKMASFLAQRENQKALRVTGSYEFRDNGLTVQMNMESPFRNAEMMRFDGSFNKINGGYRFSTNAQYGPEAIQRINANGEITTGSEKRVTFTLDTPFRPCKNVEFQAVLNDQELRTSLQYDEPSKKSELVCKLRTMPNGFDGSFELNTPYFTTTSASARYASKRDEINGKVELTTPFNAIPYFKGEGTVGMTPDSYNFEITTKTNENSRPMVLNGFLKLQTGLTEFQIKAENMATHPMEMTGAIKGKDSSSMEANLNLNLGRRDEHSLVASFKNPGKEMNAEVQLRSRLLSTNELNAKMNVNFADKRRMNFDASLENAAHKMSTSFKSNPRGLEHEFKLFTPLISKNEFSTRLTYSNNRKVINGKFVVMANQEPHSLEVSYDGSDSLQTTASLEARCRMIPAGIFKVEGKLMTPKDNSAILNVNVMSGDNHSLTAKYNYNKRPFLNVDGTLEMESPLLTKRALSVNGNLISEPSRRLESTLVVDGLYNGQSRLSINMRREEGRSLDGLVNLNLPAGPVRMFRADLKAKTDGTPQNSELSLDVETSMQNARRMSLGCKSKTSPTAFDLSVNMRLPVNGMETVSLLTTVHKNREMTRFAPRVTLTLPSEKYVLYGNYENEAALVGTIGYEMTGQKGQAGIQYGENEVKLTLQTPITGHESYSVAGSMKNERGRNVMTITFEDPRSERSTFTGSMKFHSTVNFMGEMTLRTPYRSYRDVNVQIRQQNRRGNLLTSFQCNSEGERKTYFHFEHQTTSANRVGNVEIMLPFSSLDSIKTDYTYGDKKVTLNGEVNGKRYLEIETINDEEKSFVLSLPSFPYTLKGSCKMTPAVELNLVSIAPSRTMGFTSVTQTTDNSFSQTSRITFDEKENSVFSYELRSAPRRNGGSEMVARVNLPVRSMEIRAEQAPTSNGAIMTFDILFDAARNPDKNLKVTLEHSNLGGYRTMARKLQCTISYPQMRKEIVARGEYNINSKEFFARGEVEYSRDQRKNTVFEIRAQDQSRNKRECNYNFAILASNPAARVDMKLNGEMINTADEMNAGLKMSFLGQNGRERISELRAKIEKLKQKLEVTTRMNEERSQLLGRLFNRDEEFTMEFDHTVNDAPNMHGHFRLSQRHRNMDVTLKSGEETMNIKAAMPESHIHVELAHSKENEPRTSDALFHLSLNQDRILASRLNYRPELLSDVTDKVSSMSSKAYRRMARSVNDYAQSSNEELYYAARRMNQIAEPEFSSVKNSMASEINEINNDYQRMSYNVKKMYMRNEFYMKSIHGSASQMLNAMSEMGSRMMNCMNNCFKSAASYIAEKYETVARQMSSAMRCIAAAYQRVQIRMMEMRQELEYYLDDLYNEAFSYLVMMSMDLADASAEYYEYYYDRVGQMMEPVMRRMSPFFEMVVDFAKIISNKMGGFCESETCQALKKISYDDISRSVSRNYLRVSKMVRDLVRNAGHYAEVVIKYVREHKQINNLNDMMHQGFDSVRHTAYHLGFDTLVINIFEEISAKTVKILYASLIGAIEEFSDVRNSVRLTVEPEHGRVELKMKLPLAAAAVTSLKDLQNIDYSQLGYLGNMLDSNNFADFYYQYKKYFDPNFYIPPFNGKAIVAGNQHYITFDNFHFDYAGECSYLLAKDFVDGNFTVFVNYVRDPVQRAVRKSLVMIADGVKIEVGSDYKVTKNDEKVELPQEITPNGIRVTMEDGTIFMGDERRGFAVRCNLEHDICTLELSGFYFAKTGGLLGSFNNEPAMDKMNPQNEMMENVEEFATSWRVGDKSCKATNVAKQSADEPIVREECGKLFDSNESPLRSCFGLVAPRPFLDMCINDLTYVRRENHRQKKSCTAIAAYLERCREEGVELRMPSYCVRCERYDGEEMKGGDLITIASPSTKSSDVVFVVEQGPCNKDINPVITRLANNLEEGLKSDGYNKIRFSVVGFGGEGIHAEPHVVTIDGKAFGNGRSLSTTLGNLPLKRNQVSSNVFDALRYAARLPFLAGATKTFILAKCSACRTEEMKGDYSEMLRTMLDSDITLHTIFDMEPVSRGSGNKDKISKKVIGIDKTVAYTNKESGDRDLLAQLRLPKDLCVPLSLEINGSVFNTKKVTNKKSMDIFSMRILRTLQPPECQRCECLTTNYGIGKSVCQRCISPVVASMTMDDLDFYDGKSMDDEILEAAPTKAPARKYKTPDRKTLSSKRTRKQN